MSFVEVDLFGVYVAPISVMMVAAWIVVIALRRVADHFGLLRHVWHPALFRVRRLLERALIHRPCRRILRCRRCRTSKT